MGNSRISVFTRRFAIMASTFWLVISIAAVAAGLPRVLLVENHSDVLVPWVQTGIRGAVIVNIDAHDDCTPMASANTGKLKKYLAAGDTAAIRRANGVADSGLYNIGDYITAACAMKIAKEAVWASPLPGPVGKVITHIPFRSCIIDSLAMIPIKGPVLLTVDADCVDHFARYRCITLIEAMRRISDSLRAMPWNVTHASVSYSCDGGYLPITLRWIGNALQEALEGKDLSRPDAPWTLLARVENWRRSLLPREMALQVRPLTLKYPSNQWLHVYLAEALFRADDVAGALAEGKKAARLDAGCSRILPLIGGQLAVAGRLDEAEIFLAGAPAVINAAAEHALAQGLDRAGRTVSAIGHYARISTQTANYSADLLIGYGYERLGDSAKALRHYRRAVSLLAKPVSEMAGFADLTRAVTAAECFFLKIGDKASAEALRRDHRLGIYFNKATEKQSAQ